MTSPRNTLSVLLVICLVIHGGRSSDVPKNQNRYLAHLFHKYGSHGTISFEVSLMFSTEITINFSTAHSIKYTTLRNNTNISSQKRSEMKKKKSDRGQFKVTMKTINKILTRTSATSVTTTTTATTNSKNREKSVINGLCDDMRWKTGIRLSKVCRSLILFVSAREATRAKNVNTWTHWLTMMKTNSIVRGIQNAHIQTMTNTKWIATRYSQSEKLQIKIYGIYSGSDQL